MIGVVAGSVSDLPAMTGALDVLERFGVPAEVRVVSAHRTPDALREYAGFAGPRGLRAIIAGAGGAAHLPGMLAAMTEVPVLGVPVRTGLSLGLDAVLSIAQMPHGVPVATFAVNGSGNAALFAVAMLAGTDPELRRRLVAFREEQTRAVLSADAAVAVAAIRNGRSRAKEYQR